MDVITQKGNADAFHASVIGRVNLSEAWSCPWEALADYPITPLSVVANDLWVIPENWCSNNCRTQSVRTIDFTRAVPNGWSIDKANGLIRRLKRLVILDRFQCVRSGNQTLSPGTPSVWVEKSRGLLRAAKHSIETFSAKSEPSRCPDGPTVFASISVTDFEALKLANRSWASISFPRINGLFAEGLFDDWPATDVEPYRGGSKKSIVPFDDKSFTEILRAAFWLNSIQPSVLQAYLDTNSIDEDANNYRHKGMVSAYRRERVRSFETETLRAGTRFPFRIAISGAGIRTCDYQAWPLDTVLGLKSLLVLCQTANAILILAATGMRIGELMALTPDALFYRDGRLYLKGPGFKNTDSFEGDCRLWPFPRASVCGIEAQIELATALGKRSDRFWVPFGGTNQTGFPSLDSLLWSFGTRIGYSDGKCLADINGAITAHRFRYSAARYVALSLTGASQILFDVLGHDDIEVTLGYALRDPELHQEINKIRREVRAVRFKEVFDHASENGGGAAELVRRTKADLLARSGKEQLDTDDIAEAAEILGEAEMVKPGVLCTAQPLERGACSSNLGIRDIGSCTPSCLHRLEMAAQRQDRRRKLEFLLDQINGAQLGVRVFYQGQIIANFDAFPKLIEEFGTDPRLHKALADCRPQTWAGLRPEVRDPLNRLVEASR